MEKVVVKPTWQLAWGLFWRMFLIVLGIEAIACGIIYYFVWPALWAWLRSMPTLPY
jgi:uncharacterized membrane protein